MILLYAVFGYLDNGVCTFRVEAVLSRHGRKSMCIQYSGNPLVKLATRKSYHTHTRGKSRSTID